MAKTLCRRLESLEALHSHLALADKAGSIPVAEQLTQLLHPHCAQLGVADIDKHNEVNGLFGFLESGGYKVGMQNQTEVSSSNPKKNHHR